MTDIGVSIDGRAPLFEIEAQAQAAEEGGASTLWIACHLFLRDPVTTAALALAATKKIKVALMAMSPYSIHPVYIAMAAASLDEKFAGRVSLCLGAGAPADLKAAGIASPRPLVAIGEAVKICRQLFAGEMADFDGQMFKVAGRRLANGGHHIPITLAASRPNMLKLAGRESDGVLISAATSPPFVKACLDQVGAGRKSCIVYTKLGSLDPIRRPIGFVLRGAHHAENIRLGGASSRPAGAGVCLCRGELERGRPAGERRRRAPAYGLRYAAAGARQARRISRDRPRRDRPGRSRRCGVDFCHS